MSSKATLPAPMQEFDVFLGGSAYLEKGSACAVAMRRRGAPDSERWKIESRARLREGTNATRAEIRALQLAVEISDPGSTLRVRVPLQIYSVLIKQFPIWEKEGRVSQLPGKSLKTLDCYKDLLGIVLAKGISITAVLKSSNDGDVSPPCDLKAIAKGVLEQVMAA